MLVVLVVLLCLMLLLVLLFLRLLTLLVLLLVLCSLLRHLPLCLLVLPPCLLHRLLLRSLPPYLLLLLSHRWTPLVAPRHLWGEQPPALV